MMLSTRAGLPTQDDEKGNNDATLDMVDNINGRSIPFLSVVGLR